jgi:hypothetical protein
MRYPRLTLKSTSTLSFSLRKLVLYLVFAPPVMAWGATVLWRHYVLINTPAHELIKQRSQDGRQSIRPPAVGVRK